MGSATKNEGSKKAAWPILSVVMPIYNTSAFLDGTLKSIEEQSLKDIEVICVDDGSTDDSAAIIQAHQAKDARIRYVHQPNSGAGVARNTGLDLARGTWVAFLDSDDVYLPEFLQKMVDAAERSRADVAICESDALDMRTGAVSPYSRFPGALTTDVITPHQAGDSLFQLGLPAPYNKIFRMDYVREKGLRFQALKNSNDVYFTQVAVAKASRVALVREVLVRYRIGGGASIQDDLLKNPGLGKCLCTFAALSALRQTCTEDGLLNNEGRASLDRLCINATYYSCERALGNETLLQVVFARYHAAIVDDWAVPEPDAERDPALQMKYRLLAQPSAECFSASHKHPVTR